MTNYLNEKFKLSHRLQGVANGLESEIAKSLESSLDSVVGKIAKLASQAEQSEPLIRKRKYLEKQKAEADRAFAREALGKTRFELVKSGKLKIESLYYNGKLRSIKELKRLMK